MKKYDPKTIEPKWQRLWADTKLYAAQDGDKTRPKYYMLTEFPYPSAAGLHAGGMREYNLGDVIARHKRMQGHNVLYPMGWDAFGLPTENFAIKNKVKPQEATAQNVANFRRQFDSLGFGIDWDREINTTDPSYYKWTQWLFLQFFKAGLAYQDEIAINWCPKCKTGLANEEVVDGKHERCGTAVEKKFLKQWLLKITAYADRLIEGLKTIDFPPRIADQQVNWIGRSEGAEIDFAVGKTNFKRIVLMHGKNVTPRDKWYPWFGGQVKQAGLEYVAPELGTDNVPKLADWTAKLEATKPDESTVLVGHSRGGMAILRWLEQAPANVKVGRVVLVATNDAVQPDKARGDFFTDEEYNFEKIKSHCSEFVVIHSRDDEWVPFEAGERIAKGLGVRLQAFDDKGHFGETTPQVPEILHYATAGQIITVYTTRPDTLGGATFLVLAPEHAAVEKITTKDQKSKVEAYVLQAQRETELERQADERPKTGVFTGTYAKNPITNEQMPVWVADYVLAGYGTGAIMAVPAHDERDFAFAKAFDLPIINVIDPVMVRDDAKSIKEFKQHQKIVALVENDAGEILSINWGKLGGRLTVGGTVEGNESPEATAVREVAEETGYHDLEVVEVGPETFHYKYFAFSKNEGHEATVRFVHLRLKSEAQRDQQLDDSEHGKFNVEWVSRAVAEREIVEPLHRYGIDKFVFGKVFTGEGRLANSGKFDGLSSSEAKHSIIKWLFDKGIGRGATKYKLRDWVFSRQHYWGEPIPIVHCDKCGAVPVPESQLPVTLPDVEHYEPTDTGESPLASITDWVNTTCPQCGGPAKRETDTMPNWAGSSWYYLRYMDPHNDQDFASKDKLDYWGNVDLYLGGMEHTTLHLLYSRFWHQFLYDQKLVPTPEPYHARRGQGILLANDGRKMSKSLGNVIDPTDVISQYGADAFRLYLLFMAPYDETTPWSDERLSGVSRFLYRVWTLVQDLASNRTPVIGEAEINTGELTVAVDRITHKTLKKVHDDLEGMRFNTTVSALMEYVNYLSEAKIKASLVDPAYSALAQRTARTLVLLLAPSVPHLAEELWHDLGNTGSVHVAPWPQYDPELIKDDVVTIVVQINGKVRTNLLAAASATDADLTAAALADPNVVRHLGDQTVIKTIVVPRRLVNFVVK